MIIGVPKEIKNNENRVGVVPAGVQLLVQNGHQVWVQSGCGVGSGFEDRQYEKAGATVLEDAAKVWAAEMIIKVKEPLESEYPYLREDLILFTYLHLAAAPQLTEVMLQAGMTAIGYETMVGKKGDLPLLKPMSVVAGRLSVQIGAQFLEKPYGGKGVLLSGVPGVANGKVVIIGGGVAGRNALQIALGLGAHCTILDVRPEILTEIENLYGNAIITLLSNEWNIAHAIKDADVVIGAVLIPGRKAPTLVTEEMVKSMQTGSVIVDIAVDQGGIFETEDRTTTHDDPVYERHGILHYAVPNMPGAVPRTATIALTNATLPYAVEIANQGARQAAANNPTILTGFNVHRGKLTNKDVAESIGGVYTPIETLL